MANPQNLTPNFTSGGSVFNFLAQQWNQFFASKVDAEMGQMDSPSITGTINAPTATLTVGTLNITNGSIGGLTILPIGLTGSGAVNLQYDTTVLTTTGSGALTFVTPIKVSALGIATNGTLGIIRPDNSTINVSGSGVLSLAAGVTVTPSAVVVPYAGGTAPAGWFICNGTAIARSTYAALYSALGTTYGAGDGSTTFNLPDLRGRSIAGFDPGNATGRLTGANLGGLSASTIGNTGGEQSHTLTIAELAVHSHSISDPGHAHGVSDPAHVHPDPTHAHSVADPGHAHGVSDPGHVHTYYGNNNAASYGQGSSSGDGGPVLSIATLNTGGSGTGIGINGAGTSIGIYGNYASLGYQYTGVSVNGAGTGVSANNNGSGSAHNNIPPAMIMNWIIKQ